MGVEAKKKSNTFLVDVASKETGHEPGGDYGWFGLKFIKPTEPKRKNRPTEGNFCVNPN